MALEVENGSTKEWIATVQQDLCSSSIALDDAMLSQTEAHFMFQMGGSLTIRVGADGKLIYELDE